MANNSLYELALYEVTLSLDGGGVRPSRQEVILAGWRQVREKDSSMLFGGGQ
jgi:hypothetical protein